CLFVKVLIGLKGVKCEEFKDEIEQGAGDQKMIDWLNQSGEKKTAVEIRRWAQEAESSSMYNHPEKREFFSEQVKNLGLQPEKTTTFDWLEVDDETTHEQKAARV